MRSVSLKASLLLVTGCWLLANLSGCGYTTRSMISNKYRTIYITPFVNKIDITKDSDVGNRYKLYRPMLESEVSKAVTNKYLFDGNLRPTSQNQADLTLKGELMEFRKDPLSYSDNNDVDEYRVNILVHLVLWDNKENKLVWEENNFTGDYTYFPTSSTLPGVTKKSDDAAITEGISDLARRVVERTVEQW